MVSVKPDLCISVGFVLIKVFFSPNSPLGHVSTGKESRGRDDDRLAVGAEQSTRKTQSSGGGAGRVGSSASSNSQVMPSADRERLRAEMARKLEQLQKERIADEEEERRKKFVSQ